MSVVRILDTQVHERTVNTKSGPQVFREQRAMVDQGGGYGLPFPVGLGNRAPYPVGTYLLGGDVYELGSWGALSLRRQVSLLPFETVAASLGFAQKPQAAAK